MAKGKSLAPHKMSDESFGRAQAIDHEAQVFNYGVA